jgi:hypothetical protein
MRPLSGFENSIYLKGESALSGGTATIALPSGFEAFTNPTGRTVQITCINGFSPLSVSRVSNGRFTVSTNGQGNATQAFFWEIKADIASLPDVRAAGDR